MNHTQASTVLREETTWFPCGSVTLDFSLVLPPDPRGVILLLKSRSARQRSGQTAEFRKALLRAGFAVAEVALLTADEDLFLASRYDDILAADRVFAAAQFLNSDVRTAGLDCGCLASGETSAAALYAASRPGTPLRALVVLGGRPHRAGVSLQSVRAATVLISGDEDQESLESCSQAAARLGGEHQMLVMPGASDRLAETPSWQTVCRHAVKWFNQHLQPPIPRTTP